MLCQEEIIWLLLGTREHGSERCIFIRPSRGSIAYVPSSPHKGTSSASQQMTMSLLWPSESSTAEMKNQSINQSSNRSFSHSINKFVGRLNTSLGGFNMNPLLCLPTIENTQLKLTGFSFRGFSCIIGRQNEAFVETCAPI